MQYPTSSIRLERLRLPMCLSFPLIEKQMKRHKISPIEGASTATHTFHFLPNHDDKNHY
jgi:hypothetical protein